MSYCHTLSIPPQFPYVDGMGTEIIKREILLQTEKMKATEFENEHVTQIINRMSLRIEDLGMPTPPQYSYPFLKLDIDTVKDYISIRTLIEKYNLSPTSSDEEILKSASLYFSHPND
jgi:spore coat polysaccharide biosynthesis protein SpsF (cytidylyltransferase family)